MDRDEIEYSHELINKLNDIICKYDGLVSAVYMDQIIEITAKMEQEIPDIENDYIEEEFPSYQYDYDEV